MAVDQEYIDALLANPRESLNVEIKDWIDPRSVHGQAKIIKACIAMRNQNSGFLQVGFEDGTWIPNHADAPADVRSMWDPDEIQGIVSKFASDLIEVHLRFGELDGQEFPVLEVESGVRYPVASKRELADPQDTSRKLVKAHAVYVRSLSANGTASTSEARHGDWAALTRRCFDNLEADIGRFARRHLGSIDPKAARALAEALGGAFAGTSVTPVPSEPLPQEQALTFLQDGHERFQQEKIKRDLTAIPQHGSLEAAAIIDGDVALGVPPTEEFLNLLNAANPRYTGWPLWIDGRGLTYHGNDPKPYTFQGGWEDFLYSYQPGSSYNHLDFWRAKPAGNFYLYRGFEDDLMEGPGYPDTMTTLDFRMAIWRVAEAIAVPMAFARSMGLVPESTNLHYAFRWSGLRGRYLSSWTDPRRSLSSHYECRRQNVVDSPVIAVPLDTPTSALGSFMRAATANLFAAFGGFEPPGRNREAHRRTSRPQRFLRIDPGSSIGGISRGARCFYSWPR